ncbi:hypothetical protein L211DRAFT_133663 [Terfezia boudieri ATCC MYA-4762]|uniref:Uncharacterized protein n=1 Tax=Terfezia boudieri ATCC MYA-4762 TaxID=1051890 RepID=A0A3N4LTI9_9PEZI|nr:hypothetical protein L211DRAFT_133663 [Terfezia boudieri ATCC MYA-4762]
MEQVRVLQPVSVSNVYIPRHLPGIKRAIPATPRNLRPGPKPKPLEERVYRSIPISGDDTEYTWPLEDYVHTAYINTQ